ncbi:hypothetical protein P67b_00004 [Ruegeria phage Tedan]|nr:hypothetical protein P67b_00004 [Ruegeria phage Tedan]
MSIIDIGSADNDGTGDPLRDAGRKMNRLFGGVISRTTDAPAITPALDNLYIVPEAPTGDFAGQANNLAYRAASAWEFYTPPEGFTVWVNDTNETVVWNGTAWTVLESGGNGGGGGSVGELYRVVELPWPDYSVNLDVDLTDCDEVEIVADNWLASHSDAVVGTLSVDGTTFESTYNLARVNNGNDEAVTTNSVQLALIVNGSNTDTQMSSVRLKDFKDPSLITFAEGSIINGNFNRRELAFSQATATHTTLRLGAQPNNTPTTGRIYVRKITYGGGNQIGGINNVFVEVGQSGNQSLGGGSTSTLVFGNVVEDASNVWDGTNNRMEIPAILNGKVISLTARAQHTADSNTTYEFFFEKSVNGGVNWTRINQLNSGVDHFGIASLYAVDRAATGDLYRVRTFVGSGKTTLASRTSFFLVALDTASGGTAKTVNAQTGTAYTLASSDENNIVTMDNAAANTLTIPANGTVSIAVGTEVEVLQTGAGTTTLQAAPGVALRGVSEGSAAMSGQWARATLLKIAIDAWALNGEHGAVS